MIAGASKARIALVEDNPADVVLIRFALDFHRAAYDLDVLTDGRRALDYLLRIERGEMAAPNLFLLDLNLPVHSGFELLRRIRNSPRLCTVKAVVLTTSDAPRDRDEAARQGADLYLLKPPDLDEFLALGGVLKRQLDGGG